MSSYRELLDLYRQEFIEKINYETLKLFLFELCNEKNINLYLEMEKQCLEEVETKFHQGVKRLLKQEPLAYVLGYCYFNGNKFKVNNNVLIPRYETEELVMNILIECDQFFKDYQFINAVDIGSGSGAIAISLLKDETKMKMLATDISEEALLVCQENAAINNVELKTIQGDMLEPLIEKKYKFDLLVSNPPYIPKNEEVEISVKNYEPNIALFADEDGLKYYREILSQCKYILNSKAMIAFEIGYNQKQALENLTKELLGDVDFKCIKDINQKDRMVIIKIDKG